MLFFTNYYSVQNYHFCCSKYTSFGTSKKKNMGSHLHSDSVQYILVLPSSTCIFLHSLFLVRACMYHQAYIYWQWRVLADTMQGSSQKKIKEGEGVVLRSKDICVFSDHIKYILPRKGGGGGLTPPRSRFD